MKNNTYKQIDPVIHQPVRLQLMTFLHLAKKASFSEIKKELNITDGNLGSHLVKLEAKKYIKIKKSFIFKKPTTTIIITEKGESELIRYIDLLQSLIG